MRMPSRFRILAVASAVLMLAGCMATPGATTPGAATPSPAVAVPGDVDGRYVRCVFGDVEVAKDIEYGVATNEKGEEENLLLDLYEPKGDDAPRRAAVIFVHGGGFTSGDKGSGIEQSLAEGLARKGYVTLSINYRLRQKPGADWVGTFRDSSDDAYRAFEWLMAHRDEYRIDTGHIAFGGHSAGSNIVVELCYSDWSERKLKKDGIFAVIAMAGPESIHGDPQPDDPLCVIIHGMKDELVPYALSERFADILKAAGTPYLLHPLPACPHNLGPAIHEVVDTVTSALYKEMTGRDSGIAIRNYEDEYRQILADRIAKNRNVGARTLKVAIDGDLDEWPQDGFMKLDQLKDAGTALPTPADLEASAMVAWDADNPGCLCAAVRVTDDIFQVGENPDRWQNDGFELLLDLSDETAIRPILQWIVGVDGMGAYCSTGAGGTCDVKTVRAGNTVTFEIRAAIGRAMPELGVFDPAGRTVGVSLCYNDCEGGVRQHQVGIVAGDTWTPVNFANLIAAGR